jgi:large subunit ribosomal protein L9
MKIILLERIANLGNIGDIVDVAAGYARNYLVRFGKAKRASDANIKEFNEKRSEYELKQKDILANAEARFKHINEKVFTITAKAGVDGKLFGSVNALDIAEAIKKTGIDVKKSEVTLPNGTLKVVGEFEVRVILHHDIHATVKVAVTPEA